MFESDKSTVSVDIIEVLAPTILINKDALIKMKLFVDECQDEIGWLGTARQYNDTILIDDVILFDQEVHSTTTEITPEGLSEFGEKLLQQDDGVEIWNSLRVWGHSHVNMGVSPSGQDDNQMMVFKDSGHDWFIRIIANKKGKLKLDFYNYKTGIAYHDMQWYVLESEEERDIKIKIAKLEEKLEEMNESQIEHYKEFVKNEMKEKVRKKTYYSGGVYGGTTYSYKKTYDKKENIDTKKTEKDVADDLYLNTYNYTYGMSYYEAIMNLSEEEMDELKRKNKEDGIFENYMKEEFLMCKDIDEVREVIMLYGYDDVYSDNELTNILQEVYLEEIEKQIDEEGDDSNGYGLR